MALLVPPLVQMYFHDIGQSIVMLWIFIRGLFKPGFTKATSRTANRGCQECQQYCGSQERISTRSTLASHKSIVLDLEADNHVEAGDLFLGNERSYREPDSYSEGRCSGGKQCSSTQGTPSLGHDNSEDLESAPSTPLSNANDLDVIIVRPGVFCSSPESIQSEFSTHVDERAHKDRYNLAKNLDAFDNEIDREGFYDTVNKPLKGFSSHGLFIASLGVPAPRKSSLNSLHWHNEAAFNDFLIEAEDCNILKPHTDMTPELGPFIVPEDHSATQPMNSLSAGYIYAM